MNTCGRLVVLALFFGLMLWAAPAAAGEAGIGLLLHPRLRLSSLT